MIALDHYTGHMLTRAGLGRGAKSRKVPSDASLRFADGGLPEVMRWLETERPRTLSRSSRAPVSGRDEFYGCSWEKALELARDGWQEGAERIGRHLPNVAFAKAGRSPRWKKDMVGVIPDVPRFLSGDPRSMLRRGHEDTRAKVISLYVSCGIRANISTDAATNFGLAVCEIIDALENGGQRIELNQLTCATVGGDQTSVTGWRVKLASEPLDLAALAFTFAHPAAHRRLQFAMRECMGDGTIGGSGHIEPCDFPDAGNAIIIEGISAMEGECDTREDARAFLAKRINEAAGYELVTPEALQTNP